MPRTEDEIRHWAAVKRGDLYQSIDWGRERQRSWCESLLRQELAMFSNIDFVSWGDQRSRANEGECFREICNIWKSISMCTRLHGSRKLARGKVDEADIEDDPLPLQ